MSWKECSPMDERLRFVSLALLHDVSHSELCRTFGISRKTGYKWLQRYQAGGRPGLADASRRPLHVPSHLSVELVLEIVRQRLLHPRWGAAKLRALLARSVPAAQLPSTRSVGRALERAQLTLPPKRRHRQGERLQNRLVAAAPNDVWTVDFKGWWRTQDGRRCEPLTIRDEFSRFLLSVQALPGTDTGSVRGVFEEVFRRYGLPKVIQSDNGTPFASSNSVCGLTQLSAWWLALGIHLNRSRPAHPQDNGGHERMHRDLRQEVQIRPLADLPSQQARLEDWREEFNHVRPHEALGQQSPASVYRRSSRPYPEAAIEVEYPAEYEVRMVRRDGTVKYRGRLAFISQALAHWPIGVQMISDHRARVWFTDVCLGESDPDLLAPLRPPAYAAQEGLSGGVAEVTV